MWKMCVYVYICVCVCVYIYIYIYMNHFAVHQNQHNIVNQLYFNKNEKNNNNRSSHGGSAI